MIKKFDLLLGVETFKMQLIQNGDIFNLADSNLANFQDVFVNFQTPDTIDTFDTLCYLTLL